MYGVHGRPGNLACQPFPLSQKDRFAMRTRARTLATALAIALGGSVAVATPAWAHPVLNVSASPTTVTAGTAITITITGTSNGNYTNARIEVFSTTPSSGGTTGNLTAFTNSPVCAGTPATPTCTENPSTRYRLGGINLTNNQAFSYTLTVTVDAGTAAGTFTPKAEFFTSSGSTTGPRTGPLITVIAPKSDISVTKVGTAVVAPGILRISNYFENIGAATAPDIILASSATPAGFATQTNSICGVTPGQSLSCTVPVPFPAGAGTGYDNDWSIALLALGTYTVTVTVSSSNDVTPANNTVTWTCNVVTALIITCT
jgi:hypothetical protein